MWSPYTWHPSAMIGHHSCGMFACAALNQVCRVLCIWDVHMCDTLSCHMDAYIHSTQLSQKHAVHINILYVGHPIVSEGCHLYRHPICGVSYHVRRVHPVCMAVVRHFKWLTRKCLTVLSRFVLFWMQLLGSGFWWAIFEHQSETICHCRADVTLFE